MWSSASATPRALDTAVLSIGAAAPALRLPTAAVNAGWARRGGKGTVGLCRSDEDTLTLAATAAQRALSAVPELPGGPIGLWWGTTRAPFAEGPSWAYLAAALRLPSDSDGALFCGSTHAGVDALLAAADAIVGGRVAAAVVVASDALLPALGSGFEVAAGAGAAAVVLGAGSGPARLDCVASTWEPVLDRYRGDHEFETREAYDGRLFRELSFVPGCTTVATALGMHSSTRWSLPDPDSRMATAVVKEATLAKVCSTEVRATLGDTGAAAGLLGLAAALAEPAPAALLAWGGGRATAVGIEVDAPVPGAEAVAAALAGGVEVDYPAALRARGQLRPGGESVEMAVPPGSAMFVRDQREVLGLVGARCVECNTVNVPPSVHPSCPACGGDKFDLTPLPRGGTVVTYVVNHTMPAPFEAPLPLVVVDLHDGTRIQLQGADPGTELSVGAPVELVLRRYSIERGVPVYGWKVASHTSEEDGR